jgi:hypothetical protein
MKITYGLKREVAGFIHECEYYAYSRSIQEWWHASIISPDAHFIECFNKLKLKIEI